MSRYMISRRFSTNLMESSLKRYFDGNKLWLETKACKDTLRSNAKGQAPELLWIGCSDSRAPASLITNSEPGSVFTTRNIANTVVHSDMSMLSVVQYAVEVLKVKHIAVVGHTSCGGVAAALEGKPLGLLSNWLRHIQDTCEVNHDELAAITDKHKRQERLADLHVKAGVEAVARMSAVMEAWDQKRDLWVHGWKFDVGTGVLHDLNCTIKSGEELKSHFRLPNKYQ